MPQPDKKPADELPDLSRFAAVLFDLDGVLTPTATVHMRAWEALFAEYLQTRAGVAPYEAQDYFDHIDGKPRYEGVAELLRSRNIELPWGRPDDSPEAETVCGLGNRKNVVFQRVLSEEGVTPYPGSQALLERLEASGTPMAVVSSSRNAAGVLAAAGLADRFPVVVDGALAAAEGLAGKPDPATYLAAARRLGASAERSVVVEDALSGVEAGRAGHFGLVVGVDRGAGADELARAGAGLVVADLAPLAEAVATPPLDRRVYPVDEWRLVERSRPSADRRGQMETLFALGNGYLGLRGNGEEAGAAYEHGTFINGFHETWPITYPEAAYGYATVGQTILNLPDANTIRLRVGDDEFDLDTSDVGEYQRTLHMAGGTLERHLVWRTPSGNRVAITSRRLVSFGAKHVAAMEYTVTLLDADAPIVITSLLADRQGEPGATAAAAPPPGTAEFDPRRAEDMSGALVPWRHGELGGRAFLAHVTRNSGLGLAVMLDHRLLADAPHQTATTVSATKAQVTFSLQGRRGESTTLHKLAAYHDGPADLVDDLVAACSATLDSAAEGGVTALVEGQRRWLDEFWADADVRVSGQPAVQQALRWNLFQLAQAAARADGRGIAAKGVTGSGYSGHYFWDTEIYVLPYLIHTRPELAEAALSFRHAMLPAARRRARVMDESGALFPWRTINGEEASAYYPAGTAQYHIDADVTYAVAKYIAATDDRAFAEGRGADIAVETARMWASLGYFEPGPPESFHINAVTGPDEYSAVVDDNFYTNVAARFNLRFAADLVEELARSAPSAYASLVARLGLGTAEPTTWRRGAEAMHVGFDEERGVHLQDARFMDREPWDIPGTPPEKRPLLLHYHPLVIYRHQVLKQADLVLALFLYALEFTPVEKRAAFDFYDPLTTGDSTLSAAVQSIMAAEVGHHDLADTYFERMLYVDLADKHGNAADGVHIASAGGTWQAVVAGFGGMRDDGGRLRFDPRLPVGWEALEFKLRWLGVRIRARVTRDEVSLAVEAPPAQATETLRYVNETAQQRRRIRRAPETLTHANGNLIHVEVRGRRYSLSAAQPLIVPLADTGPAAD